MENSMVSSCIYSSEWLVNCDEYQITAPEDEQSKDDRNCKEEKKRRGYKHVPHKEKPAQVVARRNARERRRVQAVNIAFARLRKAIPLQNDRGKRISKVKTLQHAIDYIQTLMELLEQDRNYHLVSHYYTHKWQDDLYNCIIEW